MRTERRAQEPLVLPGGLAELAAGMGSLAPRRSSMRTMAL